AQSSRAGEVLLAGYRTCAAHAVVEQQSRGRVGPLPDTVTERVQETHRFHQMRGDSGQHQFPLPQRFPDQSELQLLQVSQSTVEQLAETDRGYRHQITSLDEGDQVPTGHRIQRGTSTDETADAHGL